jgi:transcriptional regulator with XRE-family HTH domain
LAIQSPEFEAIGSILAIQSPQLTPHPSDYGHLIAKQAAGLTQTELGLRLGLKGRAIYRWERDDSAPTRRHHRALVAALHGLDAQLISDLTSALGSSKRNARSAPVPAAPVLQAPAISPATAFELCLFRLADELDVPPRRVRAPLSRFLQRTRAAKLTLEAITQQLDTMIANAVPEPRGE